MPPPKKPKMGRTSLEQFLSEEERGQVMNIRDLRDSEGQSPTGSLDMEGSDGEVFTSNMELIKRSKSAPNEGVHEGLAPDFVFQKVYRKSHSVDEQKVPGSPNDSVATETSTPTDSIDNGECYPGFRKYRRDDDPDRLVINEDAGSPRQSPDRSPRHNPVDDVERPHEVHDVERPDIAHDMERANEIRERLGMPMPTSNGVKLTKEQDRLLETLVASALASSVAQTIIHSRGPPATYSGTMPHLMYGHAGAFASPNMNGFDSEPHDLSKRSESHHNKLLDHRQYDNIHNTSERKRFHQPFRDWGAHDPRAITVERSKHYLDAHKRIAGLLCERDAGSERGRDTTPVQILEKENILHGVPGQHLNGYFPHLGLHARLPGELTRFEHRQR